MIYADSECVSPPSGENDTGGGVQRHLPCGYSYRIVGNLVFTRTLFNCSSFHGKHFDRLRGDY